MVFPVLGRCVKEISELSDTAGNQRLVGIYAYDPLLCARVLRATNRRDQTQLSALEQAPLFLGAEEFRHMAVTAPILEQTLQGAALAAYIQAVKRAYTKAKLAGHWSSRHGYAHPQEFFYATLLAGIGELGIRMVEPELGHRIDSAAVDGGWHGVDKPILGFSSTELSLALAREWNLPDILQQALTSGDNPHKKPELVQLTLGVMEAARIDPLSQTTLEFLERGAVTGGGVADRLREELLVFCRGVAREVSEWYPTDPGQDFIPFFPGLFRWPEPLPSASAGAVKRRTALTDTKVNRPPPKERSKVASPRKVAEKKPPEAAVRASRAVKPSLADRKPRLEPQGKKRGKNAQQVIMEALHGLNRDIGLPRVVFAMNSGDKKHIEGRYFTGVTKDSPLRSLRIDRSSSTLFSRLLDKPQNVWVNDSNRKRVESLFDDNMRQVLGAQDFFAASIYLRAKPVGILYADSGSADMRLEEKQYQQFKAARLSLINRLEAISRG